MSRKILYSPGYGAGWTSWNNHVIAQIMIDWPPIIEAIEKGQKLDENHPLVLEMVEYIKETTGEEYVCVIGADKLAVMRVSGSVQIKEYDGSESVEEY